MCGVFVFVSFYACMVQLASNAFCIYVQLNVLCICAYLVCYVNAYIYLLLNSMVSESEWYKYFFFLLNVAIVALNFFIFCNIFWFQMNMPKDAFSRVLIILWYCIRLAWTRRYLIESIKEIMMFIRNSSIEYLHFATFCLENNDFLFD